MRQRRTTNHSTGGFFFQGADLDRVYGLDVLVVYAPLDSNSFLNVQYRI